MANLRNFSQQCKFFRLNLVLCVSIKGVQTSHSYTTLSRFLWLNRTPEGITWYYTLLRKKEINSAEWFFSLFLPPPSCQKQGKWKHIKRIRIACAPCTMIPVYTLPAERKRLMQTRPYSKHCVRDELTRTKVLLSKISTPFLYKGGILTMNILRIFKPRLCSEFYFSNL